MGCGNTRGQHDEEIDGQIFARFQHIANTIKAQHIRVFVRVDDHRARSVRDGRPGEFRDGEHGALDMEMPVDKARSKVGTGEVDHFFSVVIAQSNDAPVMDGDVFEVNFSAEDIHETGVAKNQVGSLLAASDAQFVLGFSHKDSPGSAGEQKGDQD